MGEKSTPIGDEWGTRSGHTSSAVGLIIGHRTLAAGALFAYALGVLFALGSLPRSWARFVAAYAFGREY